MCFSKPDAPDLPPTPAPTPMPTPLAATTVSPQLTEGQRAAKIMNLKRGILSTIKTSPQGVTGKGTDFDTQNQMGKKTLGGA